MLLVVAGLLVGAFKFLDVYTRHGEAVEVPLVKGMSTDEAARLFERADLLCVVADSDYVKTLPSGSILEQNPVAGQKVKRGRVIYLTINTLSIPLINVPDVSDNSSLRQAEARLLASGFKVDSVEYVSGERDWVYGVKYRNRVLKVGDKVPMGAVLVLQAGRGDEVVADSLGLVAGREQPADGRVEAKKQTDDDTWF